MILLQGSAEMVPAALFDQLKNGGRLVCVLGRGPPGKAMIYRRTDGDISGRAVFDAAAAAAAGLCQAAGIRVLAVSVFRAVATSALASASAPP